MRSILHPRRPLLVAALGCALALVALAAPAGAMAAAPAFTLTAIPAPSNFAPGATNEVQVIATNVGAADTGGAPTVIEVDLPAGFAATSASSTARTTGGVEVQPPCTIAGQAISCETSAPIPPGRLFRAIIGVKAEAATPTGAMQASISGGGAQPISLARSLPVGAAPVPFDIVTGLDAPLLEAGGDTATLAGAHPFQAAIDLGFPVLETEGATGTRLFAGSGHPHEIVIDLPRGMVVDPAATPVLCTEAELLGKTCPPASQIGDFNLGSILGPDIGYFSNDVYNMVPPPGYPAEIAFDPTEGNGIFIHVLGGVRSDGDFGIEAIVRDVPALGTNPVFNDYTQLWGDPSADIHAETRANCTYVVPSAPVAPCLVEHRQIPLLTTPPDCSGVPLETVVHVDSWEEPGTFKSARYRSSDLQGDPVALSGCNQLSYEPSISVAPTTDVADSPSGLDVTVHQPQEAPHPEPLSGRATGELKDATVTLPAGLVVNPSQADGLAACTKAQIGFLSEDQEAGVHFSKQPQSCPDAAKVGTMEVTSPLLAKYDSEHRRVDDPVTGAPKLVPLKGSVYLAEPFENPFGTLLGIYLAIEDPKSGIVAKLAGKVLPDPNTGQLTAVFKENPELPLEDIHLRLFKGARASLISPPICGDHTTTTDLTPWSSPETPNATPSSSFQTTAAPGGGACPTTEAAVPNAPSFTAGTISPQAGAYSPFVVKVGREDGSQEITGVDLTLPPGLTGKLAGIPYCPEAQIAQARSREHHGGGGEEIAAPSCPAKSEVGVVDVGAGAGPTPFYTSGHAYLAGPYEGASLSIVSIIPAVAGPFDLGAVVVRDPISIDPETAQVHAVDRHPHIIEGIPLDIRSIALKLNRPDFTLNPTNCDPLAITGTDLTVLGQSAPLNQRFQVGGCGALKFAPKLELSLKGGTKRNKNPALKAVLTYPQGNYANIASAQVTLPHSEFLDQAHIQTVCTRVQFAAKACPAASIYGHATAITPLLDQPLSGPVYLRSSNNPLPDLVADLNGQIEVTLDGKVDTGKGGGIRNTFQMVPDAPVSKFVLEMQGGKKGLLVNSENICRKPQRAIADFTGQNGKVADFKPLIANSCKKKGSGHKPSKGKQGHKASKRQLDRALLGNLGGGW